MAGSSGAQGLPRRERIRRTGEFQAVFQHGRRIETGGFTLLWMRFPGERRVGFAVSRRVHGAVARNRIRRLLREAFRREKGLFPTDIAMVFIGRPAALTQERAELGRDLREAAGVLSRQAGAWQQTGRAAGPAR